MATILDLKLLMMLFTKTYATESVLNYAKEHNVCAIASEQLDEAVYTAAYVAEKLNLKGIGTETALKFTDKSAMREAARMMGVAIPEFVKVCCKQEIEDAIRDKKMNFPLIIKPVDSAASRGVYKVNDLNELKQKFDDSKRYSKRGQVIIEQFICGKEYVVEAYTTNGVSYPLVVGHRDYFNVEGTFIPSATVFVDCVSANSEVEKKVIEANGKLLKGFALNFGITHGEYIYDEIKDRVYLVEIAARGGGVFIASDLVFACCGVDVTDMYVRDVLNMKIDDIVVKAGASAYFCYLTPKGKILYIENADSINSMDGVHKAYFDNVYVGMQTGELRDKSSRKGPILVKGKTKQDCYNIAKEVRNKLIIKVETEDGVKPIIWE